MGFQPSVEEMIGFEAEEFFEDCQTQDLPVVDLRWRTRTRNQFAVLTTDDRWPHYTRAAADVLAWSYEFGT